MRISSGKWRGKNILAPEGKLKPTSDKVRQALFNILRPHLMGVKFLDLFAGSGSVGLTALSEGVEFVAFVEHDSQTYKALRDNLYNLAQKHEYQTFRSNVSKISTLFKPESFDIIFADPFYPDISSFLKQLHKDAWNLLTNEGIFILEHGKKNCLESIQQLKGYQETKSYGDTSLSIFIKN